MAHSHGGPCKPGVHPAPGVHDRAGSAWGVPGSHCAPGLLKGGQHPFMRLGAGDSIFIDRKYMKQIALSVQEIMQNKCQYVVLKSDCGQVSTTHAACSSVGGREGEEVQGKWAPRLPFLPCRLSARHSLWGQAASGEGPTASQEEAQRTRGATSAKQSERVFSPLTGAQAG